MKKRKGDFQSTGELPVIPEYMFAFDGAEPEVCEEEPAPNDIPPQPGKRKKHRAAAVLVIVIILAVGILAAALMFSGSRPGGGSDSVSVLLAGVDNEGYRTDTIVLATLDPSSGKVSLVSIPRDTYVENSGYSVPKINSAYGWVGGGDDGVAELMECVEKVTGVYPDAYMMVDLDLFAAIVDKMGGVEFSVPQDMYYEDPYQDLVIDLKAGMQRLDGEQALGLVRYRSGYAMADLTRVEVQRDFLKAAAKQWLTPAKLLKLPGVVKSLLSEVDTDLTRGNILWLGRTLLKCDLANIESTTLPGEPGYISNGSYFIPDIEQAHMLFQ